MKIYLISAIIILLNLSSLEAKILDKVLAVVDDEIITFSDIKRINQNLGARKNVAPQVYNKEKYSRKDLVQLLIEKTLIRDRLKKIGYEVTDARVEEQVKVLQKNIGLDRKGLLRFLESNNMKFEEYFELTREAMEYSLFNARVIRPTISVTEQEIKNYYYKKNQNNKTLATKYTLVDFYIADGQLSDKQIKRFPKVLNRYQTSGIIPKAYSKMETSVLSDISDDGLTNTLRSVLKKTDEGAFSSVVKMNGQHHSFFVKKKDLVESEAYLEAKNQIKAEIYLKNSAKMTKLWFEREANNHYIKYHFER